MTQTTPAVSVIICAYTEKRLPELLNAFQSVREQMQPASEIIVVVDHNPGLASIVREELHGACVIENSGACGLSGARNSGIAVAKGHILAFLDDDAIAADNWLHVLCEGFSDPQVLGVGGAVLPLLSDQLSRWFPREFLWVVGCTYQGMPQINGCIRNPIGANMAFRRSVFSGIGGFHCAIGRTRTQPLGCEETELCIRARQHWPDHYFLYQPEAIVHHKVPAQRLTWRYFCARCYCEGRSKASVTRFVGARQGLASERMYTLKVLPLGIVRGLIHALARLDPAGLLRSLAIIVGLTLTTAGYAVGILRRRQADFQMAVPYPPSVVHPVMRTPPPAVTQPEL